MKGIYFPNESVKGRHPSWAWSSLLKGRDILVRGLRWQVSDGKSINFWEDKWIPTLQDFKVQSTKPTGCDISRVPDVIRGGAWEVTKLKSILSEEGVQAITSISLPFFPTQDKLIWHFMKQEVYSVKSGYKIAHARCMAASDKPESSFNPNKNVWKVIWKLKVPQR